MHLQALNTMLMEYITPANILPQIPIAPLWYVIQLLRHKNLTWRLCSGMHMAKDLFITEIW